MASARWRAKGICQSVLAKSARPSWASVRSDWSQRSKRARRHAVRRMRIPRPQASAEKESSKAEPSGRSQRAAPTTGATPQSAS
eukprot:13749031-Alexandrium_andersonii.AAC.1